MRSKFRNPAIFSEKKITQRLPIRTMSINEQFSSRWGIILASLGMAVGAGNLWRFPRLAGQYGGTFLILWILFLLIWSIPILLAEFSIGKTYKKGVIGSFGAATGQSFTWMGFFITFCTLGITFYYSVVTAWGLRYLGLALGNGFSIVSGGNSLAQELQANPEYLNEYWQSVANGSWQTSILHFVALVVGCLLLVRGIQNGLEKANRILIPMLFILLLVIGGIALTIGNGIAGLEYMFSVKTEHFSNATVWIEALSQSAWSTGAGWGLMMTLSSYSRNKEDVTLNIFVSGFGNNTASLVAGIAILPSVFALSATSEEAIAALQAGNQALTFSIIPELFSKIPGGAMLSILFFSAFVLAAFSSLLSMIELFIKMLGDLGLSRQSAALRAAIFSLIFGLPSALSLDIFSNQDWVWGLGLIISGMFIVFAVLHHGVVDFKKRFIDQDSDFKVSTLYFKLCIFLNIGLGLVLLYWWMAQGYDANPWFKEGTWNVFSVYSNATIVTQWGVLLVVGILLNRWLYRKFVKN